VVICLKRGADLHIMAQQIPLPLSVSCFSRYQLIRVVPDKVPLNGCVWCRERGADLHMAQLMMPLPLTVSCFSKIQIGFTFMIPAHPDSPGTRAVKWVCVCTCRGPQCSICVSKSSSSYNSSRPRH